MNQPKGNDGFPCKAQKQEALDWKNWCKKEDQNKHPLIGVKKNEGWKLDGFLFILCYEKIY